MYITLPPVSPDVTICVLSLALSRVFESLVCLIVECTMYYDEEREEV